jgi:hypothetical protein
MKAKLTLLVTLHYDPLWHETPEELSWFINTIVHNSVLTSPIHPDPIGTITIAPTTAQGVKSVID